MSLLDDPLPEPTIGPNCSASDFLTRIEEIAVAGGRSVERRKDYAGLRDDSYDLLNIELGTNLESLTARLVSNPDLKGRVKLDVVARWSSYPIRYWEYVSALQRAFRPLFRTYTDRYGKRLRLNVGKGPVEWDRSNVNCHRLSYARSKFSAAIRSMATGEDDVRWRLRDAYLLLHTIEPDDLPPPLRPHLQWVYGRMTSREERYPGEGRLTATAGQMTKATGAKIAARLLEISDAIDELMEECERCHHALRRSTPATQF